MVLDSAGRTLACHAFRRELDAGLITAIGAEIASRAGTVSPRGSCPRAPSWPGARSPCRCRAARAGPVGGRSRCPRATRRRLRALSRAPRGDGRRARPNAPRARGRNRAPTGSDVLGLVLGGRIDGEGRGLACVRPFAVLGLAVEDPEACEDELARILGGRRRWWRRWRPRAEPAVRRPRGCRGPARARRHRPRAAGARRARFGRRSATGPDGEALRRSFHEARCALEVGALADGSSPAVASADDLGPTGCCSRLQEDDGLRSMR